MKTNWAKGFATFSLHERGFTLIELLIIIAILGILAGGVVVAINPLGKLNSANLAKVKTFSASVENALIMSQVGKWSFEEGSGSIVKDISGYGNDGTLNGGVAWKTSAECGLGFGGCLSFNGTVNDYVVISASFQPLPTLDDSETFEAWIKPDSYPVSSRRGVMGQSYRSAMHIQTDGSVIYGIRDSASNMNAVNGGKAPLGVWTLFTATYNGTTLKIYKNGVFIASTPRTILSLREPVPVFKVGRGILSGDDESFKGFMDEVRIYNQALLSSRIQQIYAQGLSRHQLANKSSTFYSRSIYSREENNDTNSPSLTREF